MAFRSNTPSPNVAASATCSGCRMWNCSLGTVRPFTSMGRQCPSRPIWATPGQPSAARLRSMISQPTWSKATGSVAKNRLL